MGHNRERKILWIYRQPSVLNSICNKGGYRKKILKGKSNTTIPVSIVSVVSSKNSGQTPIGSIIEKEKYYGSIANNQYLIRYVIKVDIERRFGKVRQIKRYRFTLFLLCLIQISKKTRL